MKCEESSDSSGSWQICSFFHHLLGNRIINPPLRVCLWGLFLQRLSDIFMLPVVMQRHQPFCSQRDDAKQQKRETNQKPEQQLEIWRRICRLVKDGGQTEDMEEGSVLRFNLRRVCASLTGSRTCWNVNWASRKLPSHILAWKDSLLGHPLQLYQNFVYFKYL